MPTIEEMTAFCKRKGFVFPSSEIHGTLSGFYDYGPLGVEMKRNIINRGQVQINPDLAAR